MISILYFIRKISAAYNKKTNNIANNGSSMAGCMLLDPKIFILAQLAFLKASGISIGEVDLRFVVLRVL